MATGIVKEIYIVPSRKVQGEVQLLCYYSRDVIAEGTPAAMATELVTRYPKKYLNEGAALEDINTARETRGRKVGTGYVQEYPVIAI